MQCNKSNSSEPIDHSLILKRVPGYVYWKDLNSVYLWCNDNLANVAGLSSPSEIVGKTDYDFNWGIAEADKFIEDDKYVITTGNVHFSEYTLPILNDNGIFMTVLTEKSPLLNKDGKIIGVLAIAVDITDRKEAERLKFEEEAKQLKFSNAIEFQRIIAQGVHDIRSPVAALLMTIKTCTEIPEATRLVLREASTRIQDIAEHLLNKYKKVVFRTLPENKNIKPVLVTVALSQVLSEKRIRYQELPFTFKCIYSPKSHFAVIQIDQNSFKRMLSNLINNAVEAIGEKEGTVTLQVAAKAGWVTIKIQDTGHGMPPGVVKSIMANAVFTRGKQKGRGLGLTQVRDTLRHYKGQLLINSRVGGGTQIILTLPEAETPVWLAKEIILNSDDTVIILDDDPSIHDAWEIRFQKEAPYIPLIHFNSGEKTIDFIQSLQEKEKQKVVLLADYELLKQKYNGLQVITLTQIDRSILVSNFSSDDIISQAHFSRVKILPKSLAPEVFLTIKV